MSRAQWCVSAVIAAVIGLQVAGTLSPFVPVLQERRRNGLWPFIDYPMYSAAHFAGEVINEYRVIGLYADGTEAPVPPAHAGLGVRQLQAQAVGGLRARDHSWLEAFAHRVQERQGVKLRGVRLELRPHVLSGSGTAAAAVQVLAAWPLDGGEALPGGAG